MLSSFGPFSAHRTDTEYAAKKICDINFTTKSLWWKTLAIGECPFLFQIAPIKMKNFTAPYIEYWTALIVSNNIK